MSKYVDTISWMTQEMDAKIRDLMLHSAITLVSNQWNISASCISCLISILEIHIHSINGFVKNPCTPFGMCCLGISLDLSKQRMAEWLSLPFFSLPQSRHRFCAIATDFHYFNLHCKGFNLKPLSDQVNSNILENWCLIFYSVDLHLSLQEL